VAEAADVPTARHAGQRSAKAFDDARAVVLRLAEASAAAEHPPIGELPSYGEDPRAPSIRR
jgi:hypothetical protein